MLVKVLLSLCTFTVGLTAVGAGFLLASYGEEDGVMAIFVAAVPLAISSWTLFKLSHEI